METASSKINGYNGFSTTTCPTPDGAFISWIDGAMTTTGEIRKEPHIPNKSLADPKTKVKVGCWNVRTMFSVGKTARITIEMDRGKGDQGQRVKVTGRGGDSSEGQNNLEGESARPNYPLGETWKLIMNIAEKILSYSKTSIITFSCEKSAVKNAP